MNVINVEAPESSEFSNSAISAASNKAVFENKLMTLPLTAGPLMMLGGLVINHADVLVYTGGGSILFGLGVLCFDLLFKRDVYANAYVAELNNRQACYIASQKTILESELSAVQHTGAGQQLKRLTKKIETFRLVLGSKFSPEEMVYKRYMGNVEMVHQACLENFNKIVLISKTNNAIDVDGIKADIEGNQSPSDVAELEARLQIFERGENDTAQAVSLNEQALTGLDHAMEQIRKVSSDDTIDVDDATADMSDMTDMIHEFQPTVLN